MNSKQQRLQSFNSWPPDVPVTADALAEAGFFYTNKGDEVTCFACQYSLSQWERGDDPWVEHRRHNPKCTFVRNHGEKAGFSEGGETFDSAMIKPPDSQYGTTASDSVQIKPPDNQPASVMPVLVERTANLNMQRKPKPADYSKREERLYSFKAWRQATPDPLKLVDAGFFYTGEGDAVICYSCGGHFDSWTENSDPFKRHQQTFKDCKFFLTVATEQRSEAPVEHTEELGSRLEVRNAVGAEAGTNTEERVEEGKIKAIVKKYEEGTKVGVRSCTKCRRNQRDTLFEACDHFVACWQCANDLLKCPKCKVPITSKHRFP